MQLLVLFSHPPALKVGGVGLLSLEAGGFCLSVRMHIVPMSQNRPLVLSECEIVESHIGCRQYSGYFGHMKDGHRVTLRPLQKIFYEPWAHIGSVSFGLARNTDGSSQGPCESSQSPSMGLIRNPYKRILTQL